MKRRDFFKQLGSVAVVAAAVTPTMSFAASPKAANAISYKSALDAITGGKVAKASAAVHLKAPEIAENGAVVPITITVDSPMTESDYVKSIHILVDKNANARCIDAHLTPANGKALLATRVKLNGTQNVSAVVGLSNGDFLIATQNVKVTIGGCG